MFGLKVSIRIQTYKQTQMAAGEKWQEMVKL